MAKILNMVKIRMCGCKQKSWNAGIQTICNRGIQAYETSHGLGQTINYAFVLRDVKIITSWIAYFGQNIQHMVSINGHNKMLQLMCNNHILHMADQVGNLPPMEGHTKPSSNINWRMPSRASAEIFWLVPIGVGGALLNKSMEIRKFNETAKTRRFKVRVWNSGDGQLRSFVGNCTYMLFFIPRTCLCFCVLHNIKTIEQLWLQILKLCLILKHFVGLTE